jgi:hypothetical protein
MGSEDSTRLIIVALGMTIAAAGFYHLATGGNLNLNLPFIGHDLSPVKEDVEWPMEQFDPNIVNAYNRAAYSDNSLPIDELYDGNPTNNFNNDFLTTYAPSVKQSLIPVQQL